MSESAGVTGVSSDGEFTGVVVAAQRLAGGSGVAAGPATGNLAITTGR